MKSNKCEDSVKNEIKACRRDYRKPGLTRFGLVSELTSGGNSGVTESNPQGDCGNNAPTKGPCVPPPIP